MLYVTHTRGSYDDDDDAVWHGMDCNGWMEVRIVWFAKRQIESASERENS